SPVDKELPWLEGEFTTSDIWLANVDFAQAPAACAHPQPERLCPPRALPAGTTVFDVSGAHLLVLAPVIWPSQAVSFRADVVVHGMSLDLTLQPLDGVTMAAVGPSWSLTDVPIAADGSFSADFGTHAVPPEAYPLLSDPF